MLSLGCSSYCQGPGRRSEEGKVIKLMILLNFEKMKEDLLEVHLLHHCFLVHFPDYEFEFMSLLDFFLTPDIGTFFIM